MKQKISLLVVQFFQRYPNAEHTQGISTLIPAEKHL